MLFSGFLAVFSFTTLSLILVGVILGIIFGSIPGLTTAMAIVLCLPMTFGMEPISDLSVEEMQELQGASGIEVNSTPSFIYSAISTAASAAASAQVSKAVSTLVTAAAKCES